jgi:hypothetical protein
MNVARTRSATLLVFLVLPLACFASPTWAQSPANPPAAVPVAAGPVAHFILVAKFERPLSSRTLKAGDSLTAKTAKAATLPDGTHVPKGSHLVAKVIAVRTGQPGQDSTLLAFRFESAQVKGRADIPVHGEVVAIGPELTRELGLGTSVLGRGGIAGYSGVDPKAALGATDEGDETSIPPGSTLKGVTLGVQKEDSAIAILQSSRKDITLTPDTVVRIELK